MLDLSGTLKHVPRTGDLYEQPLDPDQFATDNPAELPDIGWESEKVEVIKQQDNPAERHPYQKDLLEAGTSSANGEEEAEKDYNFTATVQDWIDYSYTRYHPRSINVIERYTHSREEAQLDTITNGMELWKDYDFQDEFTDRARQYIEECDGCQGFQMRDTCRSAFQCQSKSTGSCVRSIRDRAVPANRAVAFQSTRGSTAQCSDARSGPVF